VIHTRDRMRVPDVERARVPVMLHCFSSPQRLDEAAERGCLLSFAGNVTYPKAVGCRPPRGCGRPLLAETDSPFPIWCPRRGNVPLGQRAHTLAF
jgi:TatD DNase family protein